MLLLACITAGTSFADDPPIHVEADRMTSTEKDNSVVFTGEVDAKQGDVRIRSDVMTVYYTPKETKSEKDKSGPMTTTQEVEKLRLCDSSLAKLKPATRLVSGALDSVSPARS